jgi:hypothetical protein
MTVQIEIRPELEIELAARARSNGQSLEDFIQHLLESEAGNKETRAQMTGPERAAAFRAWVKSFPPNLPVLSLAEMSREKMYEQD